jgi:hypothetical protein
LIHGAASGADFIADRWAKRVGGVTIEPHNIPQDWWNTYGKGAGPIRNEYMVARAKLSEDKGHRVLTIAYPAPESTGTIDLIEQAVVANLPVLRYQ